MAYNQERGFSQSGLWTPTDGSGAGLVFTFTAGNARWVRTGDLVTATFRLTYPATADASTGKITGFPLQWRVTPSSIYSGKVSSTTGLDVIILANTGDTAAWFFSGATLGGVLNNQLSGALVIASLVYEV